MRPNWHILDQDVPGISARLRALSPEVQRELAAKVSLKAISMLPDADEEIRTVREALETQHGLSAEQAVSTMQAADEADDRYFDLKATGAADHEWQTQFAKARTLGGVALGFRVAGKEQYDLVNAIYELSHGVEDRQAFLDFVQFDLSALTPVRYSNGTLVNLGDRASAKLFFRRRAGRVVYVPGISAVNHELEFNGMRWVGIRLENGTLLATPVLRDGFSLKKKVHFVVRDTSPCKWITPESKEFEEYGSGPAF